MLPERLQDEHGFTIVETLVAMVVLVVGLMGTMAMLDAANTTTRSTKAREQGVALQRELVEAARSLSYSELTPNTIGGLVRATPGLAGSRIGAHGWEIVRRGVTYRMTIGVCSVDDPGDGIGTHDASMFCATGGGTTNAAQCATYLGASGSVAGTGAASGGAIGDCGLDRNFDGTVDNLTESETGGCAPGVCAGSTPDTNPDDFKRVVTLVRWSVGTGTRYALQSTVIPYPGFSGAPRVTSLQRTPLGTLTITSPAIESVALRATTTATPKASAVSWFVGGTPKGAATSAGSGTWDFTWPLGPVGITSPGDRELSGGPKEVLDGTYEIGARAYDLYGAGGPMKTEVATINRRRPYAVAGFQARSVDGVVEAEWQPARERDVIGYELWRRSGAAEEPICALSRATSCRDSSPPSSGSSTYVVYAVDMDPSGAQRRGDESASAPIAFGNLAPSPPGGLTATRIDATKVQLTWDTSAADPDGSVVSYRVYRNGTALGNAIGSTSTPLFTDTSAGGGPHTYYVAAVDDKGAESRRTEGVTA